jgi:ELWxxDGT repeat protein
MPKDFGNAPGSATKITIDGSSKVFKNSIGASDKKDFLSFTLGTRSKLSLTLNGLKDNADVFVTGLGTSLSSKKPGKSAEAITADLNPGTYSIQVRGRGKTTKYKLTLSAAQLTSQSQGTGGTPNQIVVEPPVINPPVVTPITNPIPDAGGSAANPTPITIGGTVTSVGDRLGDILDANGTVDLEDYYVFNAVNAGELSLSLTGLTADSTLELIGPAGNVLAVSANGDIFDELINYTITPDQIGTYSIRVSRPNDGSATNYSLNTLVAPFDAGGNSARPIPIVVDGSIRSVGDRLGETISVIGTTDAEDWYYFDVATPTSGELGVSLTGLSADSNLDIYGSNFNLLASSNNPSNADELTFYYFTNALEQVGRYYIRVSQPVPAATTYSLNTILAPLDTVTDTITPITPPTPVGDLTSVTSENPTIISEYIGADKSDIYSFTITGNEQRRATIELTNNQGSNIDLALSAAIDPVTGQLIAPSISNRPFQPGVVEQLIGTLNPGTYYVQVYSSVPILPSAYSLKLYTGLLNDTPTVVREINPDDSSSPSQLITVNGKAYFFANDGGGGTDLWVSAGTLDTTRKLGDFVSFNSNVGFAVTENGSIFFTGDDGVHGQELWAYLPSSDTLTLINDGVAGPTGSQFTRMVTVGNVIYYVAYDANYLPPNPDPTQPAPAPGGSQLWRSDGTAAGTFVIDKFLVGNIDDPFGVYTPDPTTGSLRERPVVPGRIGQAQFATFNGDLYFTYADSFIEGDIKPETGLELWRIEEAGRATDFANFDAFKASLRPKVLNINTATSSPNNGSNPSNLTIVSSPSSSALFFTTSFKGEVSLQRITETIDATGTPALQLQSFVTTGSAAEIDPSVVKLVYVDTPDAEGVTDRLFFAANTVDNDTGFNAGVELAALLNPLSANPEPPVVAANIGPDGEDENGNYVSTSSNPSNLVAFNGYVYFTITNTSGVTELWRSDGTNRQAVSVQGNPSDIADLTAVGNMLYFTAIDETGKELWGIGGDPSSQAQRIADIFPEDTDPHTEPNSSNPSNLTAASDPLNPAITTLYFTATDSPSNVELWTIG